MKKQCLKCGKQLGLLENYGNDANPLCYSCGQKSDSSPHRTGDFAHNEDNNTVEKKIIEVLPHIYSTRVLKYFYVAMIFVVAMNSLLYFVTFEDDSIYWYPPIICSLLVCLIGTRTVKQIRISHENIGITYVFGKKKNILVADIQKVWEGNVRICSAPVSPKSIIIGLKDGSRQMIYSRQLDEKTKKLLLAVVL